MSTNQHTDRLGIVFHPDPIRATRLAPAATYETSDGKPYTVLDFGGISVHFTSADDLERLHELIQNAVIRQQMAEAKARRDLEAPE